MAGIAGTQMQLENARRRIDVLDRAIVRLLNERAKEAAPIGSLKRELHLPLRCRERENAVFQNVKKANKGLP